MRLRPAVAAILAVLGLAGCKYSTTDLGYRAPKTGADKTSAAAAGRVSSGTSNGGDTALTHPAPH